MSGTTGKAGKGTTGKAGTGTNVKVTGEMRRNVLAAVVVSAQDWQADTIRDGAQSPMWRTLRNVRQAVELGVTGRDIVTAWQDGGITLSACSLPVVGPMAIVAPWGDVWVKAMTLVSQEWARQAKGGKRPEWTVPDVSAPWSVVTYGQKAVRLQDIATRSDAITGTPAVRAKALAALVIELRTAKPAAPAGGKGKGKGKGKGGADNAQKVTPSQKVARMTETLTDMLARGEWSTKGEELAALQAAFKAYVQGRNDAIRSGAAPRGVKATA
jgi:hypothetical protein